VPNRIIRADINRSERINRLDANEEVFYRRLLNEIDDHGLFDARLSILRATLFPLRLDRVREADISRWMAACQKAGLIVLYEAGGKPYLKVLNTRWKVRSEPKYPLPPVVIADKEPPPGTSDNSCEQLPAEDSNCQQSPAIAPLVVDVFGDGVVVDARASGSSNTPFDSFDDPLADMALAVAVAMGESRVPTGDSAAPIHEAAEAFVEMGAVPADVADCERDYYKRKSEQGSKYPLTLKILREDLPKWVRAKRKREEANGAGAVAVSAARPPVVSAPPEYRQPKHKGVNGERS
jgi:hypothetical protein